MTLGSRLKAARVSKGYSIRKAASLAGVSFSSVAKAEREDTYPNARTLTKLADCYDVSLDSLWLAGSTSLRAAAATVRRAVLLADLEAMQAEFRKSNDLEELEIAQMLIVVAYAVHSGRVPQLSSAMETMMFGWMKEKLQQQEQP